MSISDLQPLLDDVDSISSDTRSIWQNTRYLQSALDTLNQSQTTQSDYERKMLLALTGQVDGYPPIGYTPISTLLQQIAANTRNAGDILAGNPWWATNSSFVLDFNDYTYSHPDDGSSRLYEASFPQFLSIWSSRLQTRTPVPSGIARGGWVNYWGADDVASYGQSGQPALIRRGYTWFDWMTDAARSNWVLQASLAGTTDAPSAEDTAATAAVDDGDTSGTNGVPAMVVDQMDVTGVEDALDLVDAEAVGDMFPASYTGADPAVVVFSGGRYGAVTVPEVRASLAVPDGVARYLRGVASWLWRVALFVGCFVILRQEVAYWSTLGGSTSDA